MLIDRILAELNPTLWFLWLIWRPHPYALRDTYPSWWAYWRESIVGPREACTMADAITSMDRKTKG